MGFDRATRILQAYPTWVIDTQGIIASPEFLIPIKAAIASFAQAINA
jgi:hypothetical protein